MPKAKNFAYKATPSISTIMITSYRALEKVFKVQCWLGGGGGATNGQIGGGCRVYGLENHGLTFQLKRILTCIVVLLHL